MWLSDLLDADHPIHVKTGLIKTEINRFRQNSSADADFETELTTLRAELIARQYPPHFVQAVFTVHMPSRRTLIDTAASTLRQGPRQPRRQMARGVRVRAGGHGKGLVPGPQK